MLRRLDPGLLAAALIGLIASAPLLSTNFVGSHDAFLSVYRATCYVEALRDGVVFPRWCPEMFFGYGYPIFNYYAPLSTLLVAALALVGIPIPVAVHLIFAASAVFGAVGMVLWLRPIVGDLAALVGAAVMTFAPFHIVDVYYRGGLPEFLAMALFPWILWGLARCGEGRWQLRLVVAAVAFGGLILSHNVMALIFAPVAGLYALGVCVARWRSERALPVIAKLSPLLALTLGVLVTAFFWLPALGELDLVRPQNLRDNPLVDFRQFFTDQPVSLSLLQEYGSWTNGVFSYRTEAGLVQLVLAALGSIAGIGLVATRRLSGQAAWLLALCASGLIVSLALMFRITTPIWETVPLMRFVQYPWRFLAPMATFSGALAALMILGIISLMAGKWVSARRTGEVATVALVVVTATAGMWNLNHRMVAYEAFTWDHRGAQLFESMTQTVGTTSIAEYVPATVPFVPTGSAIALDRMLETPIRWFTNPAVETIEVQRRTHDQRFRIRTTSATTVDLPIAAFPGWQVSVNGVFVEPRPSPANGLLQVDLPPGEHDIRASLGPTPIRTTAQALTVFAVIVLVALVLLGFRVRSLAPARSLDRQSVRAVAVAAALVLAVALASQTLIWGWYMFLGRMPHAEFTGPDRAMVSRIVPYPAEFGGGFCYQLDSSASDRTWFIHLLDSMGQRRAQADGPVRVCDSLLTWLRVPAPDGLPPGPYTVRLGPLRPDTNRRMTMVENRIGYSWLPSGAIDFPVRVIQATPFVPFGAPGPQTVVGQVRLVSTDSQLRAGQPLDLELDWFPTATSDRTLVQSLQLLAPDGRLVAQRDQQPALGAYPTTAWIPGTLFRETITLDVPSGLPAGAYRAILALYDPVTGQREQWSTGEDAVTLAITSLVTP